MDSSRSVRVLCTGKPIFNNLVASCERTIFEARDLGMGGNRYYWTEMLLSLIVTRLQKP